MLLLLRKRDDEGDEIGVLVAVGGRDMSQLLVGTAAQVRLSLSSELGKVDVTELCELSTRGLWRGR